MLVLVEWRKPEYAKKKPLGAKERTQQQTKRTYGADTRIRTWPHWWEASALTTVQPWNASTVTQPL